MPLRQRILPVELALPQPLNTPAKQHQGKATRKLGMVTRPQAKSSVLVSPKPPFWGEAGKFIERKGISEALAAKAFNTSDNSICAVVLEAIDTFYYVHRSEVMTTTHVATLLRTKPSRISQIPFNELPHMDEGAGRENLYLREHVIAYVKRKIDQKRQQKNFATINRQIDQLADSARERSSQEH